MELKYKEQKIRDLFVYHTGIYPVEINIHRHEVTIVVKEHDLQEKHIDADTIENVFTTLLGRKTILKMFKEDDLS